MSPLSKAGSKTVKPVVLSAVLALLISIPAWGGQYITSIFILIFLYTAIAQMWNLLGGYSGLISLGQQSFVGIGGYALAMASQVYKLPVVWGFAAAGVLSVLFAFLTSFPIFKMKNVYFTIGTWIVSECLRVFFLIWPFVNYGTGYNISATYRMSPGLIYYISMAIGLCSVALVVFLLRSKFGLSLMAMRDNESAAEIRGIELYKTKLKCFLISSFVTGIAGSALYLNLAFIQPNAAFSIDWTVSMVFIVIIGGIGTVEGPIVGAILFVLLRQYLYSFPGFSMLLLGVVAIVIILIAPRGIVGYLNKRFGLDVFSVRRHPSGARPVLHFLKGDRKDAVGDQ
jgi:branched-chain amino acid transport system permease protein